MVVVSREAWKEEWPWGQKMRVGVVGKHIVYLLTH